MRMKKVRSKNDDRNSNSKEKNTKIFKWTQIARTFAWLGKNNFDSTCMESKHIKSVSLEDIPWWSWAKDFAQRKRQTLLYLKIKSDLPVFRLKQYNRISQAHKINSRLIHCSRYTVLLRARESNLITAFKEN